MKLPALSALVLACVVAIAADKPEIPAASIAIKKELLFSDDFSATELGKAWAVVVPTYVVEDGVLKGTQTRVTAPAADGKPAVQGHAAVIGNDIPTKDSVVECKIRFGGATALSVEFDDRKYTGSHYGHICRCIVTLKEVTILDEKDGSMRNDIYAMTQPSQKEEKKKLLEGRRATFKLADTLGTNKNYTLVVETVGDTMRATLDGKPVAFLKSTGIAHPTKSKIELGCAGKDGYFDDIKVWNAEPVKE